jgi:hypothetical protein
VIFRCIMNICICKVNGEWISGVVYHLTRVFTRSRHRFRARVCGRLTLHCEFCVRSR